MNIDDFRVVVTVLAFVAFISIVVWAYSRKRKRDFDAAARLPFTGEGFAGEENLERTDERVKR
jgi:cytochrome c oxidase cbb3-type subunit IV